MSDVVSGAPEHAEVAAAPGRGARRTAARPVTSAAPATQPAQSPPLPVEAMTSRQLVRRAQLIEAVIDLVREVGPGVIQMRDVAERSGIALGTVYRYFSSKEHLLAVALCDWQERLTRRMLMPRAGDEAEISEDLTERVLSFIRKEIRGFARNPRIAELMVQVTLSSDPYARDAIARMGVSNGQVMDKLLEGVAPERAETIKTALGAVLMNGLTYWVTGRITVADLTHQVESVTRLVLERAAD
jgi:AcrR family transcriptional regulator